ncbi:MAG: hypothetical protein RJQ01_11580 [Microcella sp.]|uniref:hypothetical protein n=1 Tax=Microcella sp. TaxID=1913979 RepID=UPI003315C948
MSSWTCFVIMPFAEEFADVYLLLKDVRSAPDMPELEIFRADDIAEPGRITDQILDAIGGCAFVIADVTGSNPNVMFELGYARALGKPGIILNQDVTDSPFDIAEMRQIVYDRQRLVGDLRPQVTTAVKATLARLVRSSHEAYVESLAQDPEADAEAALVSKQEAEAQAQRLERETITGDEAAAILEALGLELELTQEDPATRGLANDLAKQAKQVIDRVDTAAERPADLARLAATVGDLAVGMHNSKRYRDAEDLFNRALTFDDKHAGVHVQLALHVGLYKHDLAKAEELLRRAEQLGAQEGRVESARSRIRAARLIGQAEEPDRALLEALAQAVKERPHSVDDVTSYMFALQRAGRWDELVQVGEQVVRTDHWKDDPREAYSVRRTYADALASSDERRHEMMAISMYRDIMVGAPDDAQVLSNLATLLMRGTEAEKREGVALFLRAYTLRPEEAILRRNFSNSLRRVAVDRRIALQVLRGEPLSEAEIAEIQSVVDEGPEPET